MSGINSLGPLKNGSSVAVIGGGPAGCSCALAVKREAAKRNANVEVSIFEHKHYGSHYNQCLGVLSPPVLNLLQEYFDIIFPGAPSSILQRKIEGYILYTKGKSLDLPDAQGSEPSYASRRVSFDDFLLTEAEKRGVKIIKCRVSDIEIFEDEVIVYGESGNIRADIVVGACGLDTDMMEIFRNKTGFKPPSHLDTVVTKLHIPKEEIDAFGSRIKAYISEVPGVEFAAITPKHNHISIVMAGKNVDSRDFRKLIETDLFKSTLSFDFCIKDVHKGRFPNSPAKNFYGNRYVLIGDAAGLIRPFKGKGINSAIITGNLAAITMFEKGISREALKNFEKDCRFLIGDYWYGMFVRFGVKIMSRFNALSPVLSCAENNTEIREALYKSVSGSDTYKKIVMTCFKPENLISIAAAYFRWIFSMKQK